MDRLTGKVALVSGGARGMDEAFARAMIEEGAKVVICDLLDEEGQSLAKELGDGLTFAHLDVTDPAEWDG